jgi:hypothetical protein
MALEPESVHGECSGEAGGVDDEGTESSKAAFCIINSIAGLPGVVKELSPRFF